MNRSKSTKDWPNVEQSKKWYKLCSPPPPQKYIKKCPPPLQIKINTYACMHTKKMNYRPQGLKKKEKKETFQKKNLL